MRTYDNILDCRIGLYIYKYKLSIKVDKLGHADRNRSDEVERQKALEKELDCVFIRIKPDEKN